MHIRLFCFAIIVIFQTLFGILNFSYKITWHCSQTQQSLLFFHTLLSSFHMNLQIRNINRSWWCNCKVIEVCFHRNLQIRNINALSSVTTTKLSKLCFHMNLQIRNINYPKVSVVIVAHRAFIWTYKLGISTREAGSWINSNG